jgi:E3 ubiquitin-protein ligase UBR4
MNTTRAIGREDANLNAFLEQPRERWLEGCYVADGPLYFAVMALHIAPPSKWKNIRVKILQRLLLTAHCRSVSFVTSRRIELSKKP